ncbi:site-2 protease family protein [candidate division GN15 bacterium]|nr:site-2 protease family protein [candidate division GN15 bacterium]
MATASRQAALDSVVRLVADLYVVDATYQSGSEYVLALRSRFARTKSLELLRDRLNSAGYTYRISEQDESITLQVDPKRKLRIPRLNIIMFALTIVSIYIVPVFFRHVVYLPAGEAWDVTLTDLARGAGLEFAAAIVSILLVHEMGHFIASRRRDIVTSWPFFIPAPNIIGTFGAVIKSKSPFWNRRDLIEVGAAGPIAGWIVAIGWLLFGLVNSRVVPVDSLVGPELAMTFSLRGESLLIQGLIPWLVGSAPEGYAYVFSEAAFAGWVGLLVTAINMLPIGQLDGGHICYGLFGRDIQRKLGWAALIMLLILGYYSMIWWLFAVLGLVVGVKHPPTLNDKFPVSRAAQTMGIVALVILVLSFTPIPFPTPW